jgi:hypothetical protein
MKLTGKEMDEAADLLELYERWKIDERGGQGPCVLWELMPLRPVDPAATPTMDMSEFHYCGSRYEANVKAMAISLRRWKEMIDARA